MNKRQIIASLNKVANELDLSGLFKEATELTNVMHKVAQMTSPNGPNYLQPQPVAASPMVGVAGQIARPYTQQPQAAAVAPVGGAIGQMAANPNANLTALTGVGLTPRQLLQAQQQAQKAQQQQAQQQKQEFAQNAQAIINGMSTQLGGDINKMIQATNQYLRQGTIGPKLHNDIMYILNMRRQPAQPAQPAMAQKPGAQPAQPARPGVPAPAPNTSMGMA